MTSPSYVCVFACVLACVYVCACVCVRARARALRLCYFHILPEYRAFRSHANNALNYSLWSTMTM